MFVKAVDLGSFAAAAAALDLSGPMVGKHVRFLEERMGVRLLNRTARRQSLTEFGVAYYDRCGLVLAEAQAAEELAADQLTQPSGRLRVALPVLFGRRCVTPVLLELAQRHPGLELDLSFDDRLVDLAEGGFDLAIRTGALADSASVIAKRVARQRMIVCASPSYLAEHGVPQRVEDLPEHQAVVYRRAGSIPPWQFPLADGTELAILPPNKLRLDDMAAIADAAAAGLGLAWLASWLVREQMQAGSLTWILQEDPQHLLRCARCLAADTLSPDASSPCH